MCSYFFKWDTLYWQKLVVLSDFTYQLWGPLGEMSKTHYILQLPVNVRKTVQELGCLDEEVLDLWRKMCYAVEVNSWEKETFNGFFLASLRFALKIFPRGILPRAIKYHFFFSFGKTLGGVVDKVKLLYTMLWLCKIRVETK